MAVQPPSARHAGPQPMGRMRSATDLAGARGINSPLTALRIQPDLLPVRVTSAAQDGSDEQGPVASSSTSSSLRQTTTSTSGPVVPPIDFNLFQRSKSRYSVDSMASLSTISHGDSEDEEDDEEGATTPRAVAFQQADYFASSHAGPSQSSSSVGGEDTGQVTPKKKTFLVRSRNAPAPPSPARAAAEHLLQQSTSYPHLRPQVGRRPRSHSRPEAREVAAHLPHEEIAQDTLSIHGEQGEDWGEDEANFEWLDADAPEAMNGDGGEKSSPSKRLAKLKASMKAEGKRLKKPVALRKAPPPPLTFDSMVGPASPKSRTRSSSKASSPSTVTAPSISHPTVLQPAARRGPLQPSITQGNTSLRPPLNGRWTADGSPLPDHTRNAPAIPSNAPQAPIMVALKDEDDLPRPPFMAQGQSRNSHMSFQSMAYSFYELGPDGSSPTTPTATPPLGFGPSPKDLAFPNGRYHKVSLSKLEKERDPRERTISEPVKRGHGAGEGGKTPDDFVEDGLEAKARGDAAKAVWYFMKAAEGGSIRGRIHWGLCFKLGQGVAQNDKRAVAELHQACNKAFFDGGAEYILSTDIQQLPPKRKGAVLKDLAACMSELGNAYLQGAGVKKTPDAVLRYLRCAASLGDVGSQEQMGFLLSKGSNGIKKDMKEAAKWYRMAVDHGSKNTLGLSWIYKDKYTK